VTSDDDVTVVLDSYTYDISSRGIPNLGRILISQGILMHSPHSLGNIVAFPITALAQKFNKISEMRYKSWNFIKMEWVSTVPTSYITPRYFPPNLVQPHHSSGNIEALPITPWRILKHPLTPRCISLILHHSPSLPREYWSISHSSPEVWVLFCSIWRWPHNIMCRSTPSPQSSIWGWPPPPSPGDEPVSATF